MPVVRTRTVRPTSAPSPTRSVVRARIVKPKSITKSIVKVKRMPKARKPKGKY